MQTQSPRSTARDIHADTQADHIRIHPSWAIGRHAMAHGPIRTYRKPSRIIRAARATLEAIPTLCAWAVISAGAIPSIAFGLAMVSPTGSAGQRLAGAIFSACHKAFFAIVQSVG